jgi:hypothetical protein
MTSEYKYGDLPDEETTKRVGELCVAVMSFLADETKEFRDEDTPVEIVVCTRMMVKGVPLHIGMSMPDDPNNTIDVLQDLLGALHQQVSESPTEGG